MKKRKSKETSAFEVENQWGKYGEVRNITSTQKSKSKPSKGGKISSTSVTREITSKRSEKTVRR
jgi:hypothetical protein